MYVYVEEKKARPLYVHTRRERIPLIKLTKVHTAQAQGIQYIGRKYVQFDLNLANVVYLRVCVCVCVCVRVFSTQKCT